MKRKFEMEITSKYVAGSFKALHTLTLTGVTDPNDLMEYIYELPTAGHKKKNIDVCICDTTVNSSVPQMRFASAEIPVEPNQVEKNADGTITTTYPLQHFHAAQIEGSELSERLGLTKNADGTFSIGTCDGHMYSFDLMYFVEEGHLEVVVKQGRIILPENTNKSEK